MALDYTRTEWKAGREGGTAWTPARLNNMEDGIEKVSNAFDGIDVIPITSGSIPSGTSTLSVTFNKTYAKAPLVMAVVYSNTSYEERVIRVNRPPSATKTGATMQVINPYDQAQELSTNRAIYVLVIPSV